MSNAPQEQEPVSPWGSGWLWLVVVLAGTSLAFLASRLVVPDLVQGYPFMGGDGQDWISNGLHWAGYDVRYTVRPPLLPLLMAALVSLDALELFPFVPLLAAHTCAVACFLVIRRRAGSGPAAAVSLALLFNPIFLTHTLEVMADVTASCLLFGAAICFWRAEERPGWYTGAGALAGLAAITQQAALLFPVAAAPIMLMHRRHHARSLWLWVGAAALAAPPATWLLGRLASFGTVGGVGVTQWGLLRFHLDASFHYTLGATALLGLPGLALAGAGAVLALTRNRRDQLSLLALSTVAVLLGFFVLLYDFPDRRFLVQIHWFAGILMGDALAALRPRAGRVLAAGALVAWGVVAAPVARRDPATVTILPAPAVSLRFASRRDPVTGGVAAVWSVPKVVVSPFVELPLASPHLHAWATTLRSSREVGPDRSQFAHDHSALLLYRSEAEVADRYQTVTRAGNLLGKRVKLVRADVIEAGRDLLTASRLGSLEGRTILRGEVVGLDGTWLLLVGADDPLASALGATKSARLTADSASLAAMDKARRLLAAAHHPNPEMHLGVVTEASDAELSVFFVALLATTTNLRFADSRLLAQVESTFAALPGRPITVVDGTEVRHFKVLGQPAALIVYAAPHPPAVRRSGFGIRTHP